MEDELLHFCRVSVYCTMVWAHNCFARAPSLERSGKDIVNRTGACENPCKSILARRLWWSGLGLTCL
jgi:hypothetical protein